MLNRQILPNLIERLNENPAVALLGPRQVGKTTLALKAAEHHDALYLDLESHIDRSRLDEPEAFLESQQDRLVILDEIHRMPGLFPVLRGLIDRGRRQGKRSRRFLILGSASLDLLKQSGETLAGRISYLELQPLNVLEMLAGLDRKNAQSQRPTASRDVDTDLEKLWLRGGYPESYLASSEQKSSRWRADFIRTYLEREVLQFSPRLAPELLSMLWRLLASQQGGLVNVASLSRSVGMDVKTTQRYLDLLVNLMLLRRLPPWSSNLGKRLVRSPKLYIRDSGLLHSLLGINTLQELKQSILIGASWEGFVIDNLLSVTGEDTQAFFYRSSGGAEVDLILQRPGQPTCMIEIKRSLAPSPSLGFQKASGDFSGAERYLIYPGSESFPVRSGIQAIGLQEMMMRLRR
jgi:uncharacterized protein